MAGSLERRVDALESRVDELAGETRQATAVSAAASQDAATALAAHRQNTRLLTALRGTQAEHSRTLAEHSRRFDAIDARFDGIDARLDALDGRLGAVEARLVAVDGTLGRMTVGMHTIESLLRRALDDAG